MPAAPTGVREGIDMDGLRRSLGLDSAPSDMGYKEAEFNTCSAGFGYSAVDDCAQKIYAIVRFRLQCRDSEGTVSTGLGASDLIPIANKSVKWALGSKSGDDLTDQDGYGEAEAVFVKSPHHDRLRLAIGNQFLYVRADDVTRIVVPRPWCD